MDAACTSADDLAEATGKSLEEHPDAAITTSFPGLGYSAARPGGRPIPFRRCERHEGIRGISPLTRASGKSVAILARRVKNQRLAAVGYASAFASLTHSDGARAHYDRRRQTGDRHTVAQRNLFNRMIGCLLYLTQRVRFEESNAFPAATSPQGSSAT